MRTVDGGMVRATAAPRAPARRLRVAPLPRVSERRGAWLTLGGCLLIALLLRVPWLSAPLGRDEGGIALLAQHWGGGSLYGEYWLDRPPLLILLFKLAVLGGADGVRALGAAAALALVAAVTFLARALAGVRAGMIAGLLAALLSGSSVIASVYTPGELLAAVPSTLSVLCLVHAHRSRRTWAVVAAGALAVTAVLVKQSFLDAGFAGVVFVLGSALAERRVRVRWPLAYALGAAVPLALVLAWLAVAGVSLGYFVYTMFGFRLDLLHTLAVTSLPLVDRLRQLEEPAWDAGLTLVVAGAVAGLVVGLRRDRVLIATCAAWLAAAVVGVLGGGSYFVHYLIELVPVGSVLAAAALARLPAPAGAAALAVVAYLALTSADEGFRWLDHHTPHHRELAIGSYIRQQSRPGDTLYVMYARPNIVFYSGRRQPYPYLWSLMVIVRPGAVARLQRLLASPRRPTWLVRWHHPSSWELDPYHATARTIDREYRLAATVCDVPVYVRRDAAVPPGVRVGPCP
jgi:4-amino-4-deoxy-L-arabinose transferase-like glycosyltransferase